MPARAPGSGPAARLSALAFIHRFGSTLNPHLHFHCVVIDGVFDVAAAGSSSVPPPGSVRPPSPRCSSGYAGGGCASSCAVVCCRPMTARAMAQWQHGGGFSVDASVRIEAADRAGRERLLRYCARPPFALERLPQLDGEQLSYDHRQSGPGGSGPQILTPLKLLDRLAAVVPPLRVHRHRYFGVLAPNSPRRSALTALALVATPSPPPHPARNPPPNWRIVVPPATLGRGCSPASMKFSHPCAPTVAA